MLKKLLYIALLGFVASSCSENLMDDINKDLANPPAASVDAKFQITDAIMSTAYTSWGGAYAWYVSSFTEQTFGTGNNQLMKTELRQRTEVAASSTFNNEWNGTYANLENIRQIIEKCAEGGLNQNQPDLEGMAEVLWVLNAECLTDLHGDIPYSEALVVDQPKIDSQESIYTDLLTRIEKAEALLAQAIEEGADNVGQQDILYGGDTQQWLALAHAVKARLYLNTSYRDSAALAKAGDAAQAALDAGFDGAQLSLFNGVDCDNSWAAYNWSRYYVGANATVAQLMAERQDPRYEIYAWDAFETGVPYAEAGNRTMAMETYTVGLPMWLENGAAQLHIVSLSEVYFTLAEVKARTGVDATADMAAGIAASFADYGEASTIGALDATDYVESLGEATLQEVMVQKYLAQTRDEQIQTYNDIRRCKALGTEYITLNNPNNVSGGQNQWPLRLPYGNSDVVSNPNVAAAFGSGNDAGNYIYTENIWLFGGSR